MADCPDDYVDEWQEVEGGVHEILGIVVDVPYRRPSACQEDELDMLQADTPVQPPAEPEPRSPELQQGSFEPENDSADEDELDNLDEAGKEKAGHFGKDESEKGVAKELETEINSPISDGPDGKGKGRPVVLERLISLGSLIGETNISEIPKEYKELAQDLCTLLISGDRTAITEFIQTHSAEMEAICVVTNDRGETPITLVGSLGLVGVMQELSDTGLWIHGLDDNEYMAIHRAACNGHVGMVQYLAEEGQWSSQTKSGFTALHIAANNGNTAVIAALLPHMKDMNIIAQGGWLPLHLAARNGHAETTELLCGNGANTDLATDEGKTALFLAARDGYVAVVDTLIMYGAAVDPELTDSPGVTPLCAAAEGKHEQVLCRLLEAGANPNAKDGKEFSVLHRSAANGLHAETVAMLCDKGADVNAQNSEQMTGLLLACVHGHIDVVSVLLQKSADPNIPDAAGWTPLYAAAHNGHHLIVEKLIEHQANVDVQTRRGSTPLYTAAKQGLLHVVKMLIQGGANVNLARNAGWTPLHIATQNSQLEIAEALIKAGAGPNTLDQEGRTSMALAAHKRDRKLVRLYASKTNDPIFVYHNAKLGNCPILRFMSQNNVNLDCHNLFGWRALHYASQQGNVLAAKALIGVGADVNVQDNDGNSPLHVSVLNKQPMVARCLLEHMACVNKPNRKGDVCLGIAAKKGSSDLLALLLRHRADVNATDTEGRTPLYLAAQEGWALVVERLIHHRADIMQSDRNGTYPLHAACSNGHVNLLQMLLGFQLLDVKDGKGNTCLHLAARGGHLDTVVQLILNKANVNSRNSVGQKALHLAALEGHAMVVEALMDAGTKIALLNEDDCVVYDFAKHNDVWEVLKTWASVNPTMLRPAAQRVPSRSPSPRRQGPRRPSHPGARAQQHTRRGLLHSLGDDLSIFSIDHHNS